MVTADLVNATCWDNVVDFRWHKSIKSPNWDVWPQVSQDGYQIPSALEGTGWAKNNSMHASQAVLSLTEATASLKVGVGEVAGDSSISHRSEDAESEL